MLPVPHRKKMGWRELIIVPGKVGQGTCPCVPVLRAGEGVGESDI